MLEKQLKNQLKLRLEEMMANSQKYDFLRAIYLLERLASYKTKNLEEKEVRKHIRIKGVTTLNFSQVMSTQFNMTIQKKISLLYLHPFFFYFKFGTFTSNLL